MSLRHSCLLIFRCLEKKPIFSAVFDDFCKHTINSQRMKGIVFTEFFEMVEEEFGYEMVDTLVETTVLPSGGIYTAVGTYDYNEIISLVANLSQRTQIPVPALLRAYGKYLFKSFTRIYNRFLQSPSDAFTFLGSIHDYIHVEVQKLYPDAELPHFDIERVDDNTLIMNYYSKRKMADFAHGLIEGTLLHFSENATITQQAIKEDGSHVQFVIVK